MQFYRENYMEFILSKIFPMFSFNRFDCDSNKKYWCFHDILKISTKEALFEFFLSSKSDYMLEWGKIHVCEILSVSCINTFDVQYNHTLG